MPFCQPVYYLLYGYEAMNCCDDYGKCTQGKDCPVRTTNTPCNDKPTQTKENIMKKTIAIILAASILAGCASGGANHRPVIDARPGTTVAQQESDLRECQALANQVASGAERAASGAVIGAVLGSILAAALGAKNYQPEIAQGAAFGVAMEGAAAGEKEQRGIIAKCMLGRGHRVVN